MKSVDDPDLGAALLERPLEMISTVNIIPPKGGSDQHHAQVVLSEDEYAKLVAGERWLAFIGTFFYVDTTGDEYETGFSFACDARGALRMVGSPATNYMD